MGADAKREVIGAVVRGFVSAVDKKGLKNQLLPVVSEPARNLLKDPPLHITWVPGSVYEELLVAAGKLGGAPVLRALGHDLAFMSAGPILRPLLKTLMNLFGGGPAAILKNLNRAIPMQYRGVRFDFESDGDRGGAIVVDYGEPVNPLIFSAWEGSFEFGSEVTGTKFEVGTSEVAPDRRSARMRVRW